MAALTVAERNELLAFSRSAALREDLRSIAHERVVDFDAIEPLVAVSGHLIEKV